MGISVSVHTLRHTFAFNPVILMGDRQKVGLARRAAYPQNQKEKGNTKEFTLTFSQKS